MNDMKSKNFSFIASVFSTKLFSFIAATILLLLVDGGINNSANAQGIGMLENMVARVEALETVAKIDFKPLTPRALRKNIKVRMQLAIRIQSLEKLMGLAPRDPSSINIHDLAERIVALEKAFTNNPPTTQQTSVQQDITSTGNSATQQPLAQTACNMMINGVCDPTTATGLAAVVGVAVIGGITAGVLTAVNNQVNSNEQREKDRNLLLTLIAIQNGQQKGGQAPAPAPAPQCFNLNNQPIPCP